MDHSTERRPVYRIEPGGDGLHFAISDYGSASPFSGFFPGIAGVDGIPAWCFYVDRGQAVCSFGVEDKDGAVMEFQPANKAYRLTATHGFRTFLRYRTDSGHVLLEPFRDSAAHREETVGNRMVVSPYDLRIEETNIRSGLYVRVDYATLPGEPVAGLVRKLTLTNTGDHEASMELLDGMPLIVCSGTSDWHSKNMSRTIEAWTLVENQENGVPYYRLRCAATDSPEVASVLSGNFHLAYTEDDGLPALLRTVYDPERVFGPMTDLGEPEIFARSGFDPDLPQRFTNRTCCAFAHAVLTIPPGGSKSLVSIFGHADDLASVRTLKTKALTAGYLDGKLQENRRIVRGMMDLAFVKSRSKAFDAYARQGFLDNTLRGGLPVRVGTSGEGGLLHLYSRRHGDLERDYNAFRLSPTRYSQGNGAYRDMNQNRRNDVWVVPEAGLDNLRYFLDFIQLDGYNPLSLQGCRYVFDGEGRAGFLKDRVEGEGASRLSARLDSPFLPSNILTFLERETILLLVPVERFLEDLLARSRKVGVAEHGEGYWTDHWHYNLDLLESLVAVFPEAWRELASSSRPFTWYDDEFSVVPRSERYVLRKGLPRQLGSVRKDPVRVERLRRQQGLEQNRVRTGHGQGGIHRTSLAAKLLCILLNKLASLDPDGVGVEMEAGKPNWNDAINGLPSLFGSSTCETFELKRLVLHLLELLGHLRSARTPVLLPIELADFLDAMRAILSDSSDDGTPERRFAFWDAAETAKEEYRDRIRHGIDGEEREISPEALEVFLLDSLTRIEHGLARAFDPRLGIHVTYYLQEPVHFETRVNPERPDTPELHILAFRPVPLPPFLEAQVHALRVEKDPAAATALHRAVRASELHDDALGMYRSNGSLAAFPMDLGRIRAFTPGWLENESIFLHMEFKYLLELLKAGLFPEFYEACATALPPYLSPEVYGRSPFENSSFLASSANPDSTVHGRGFVARLSGTTAEFQHMLLLMALGRTPFRLDSDGRLVFAPEPAIAGFLFTDEPSTATLYVGGTERHESFEAGTYAMMVFGTVLVAYHNLERVDTFGEDAPVPVRMELRRPDGTMERIEGGVLRSRSAEAIRRGEYDRIDIHLEGGNVHGSEHRQRPLLQP